MINLTKLNGVPFVLNCEMIESITSNPDTTILLTNGTLYIVKESIEDVVRRTVGYQQRIYSHLIDPRTLKSEE